MIGIKAKKLTGGVEEAANYIAGYSIVHDVTEDGTVVSNDWQRGAVDLGKCCDGIRPARPW